MWCPTGAIVCPRAHLAISETSCFHNLGMVKLLVTNKKGQGCSCASNHARGSIPPPSLTKKYLDQNVKVERL